MESKINTVGLTIWGYKQGCKVLASQGVNFQLKEIKDRLKDLSAFIRIHIPRVDFYTLQFTQNYKIYTQYRSSREVNGQTGVYIAISLYIPHSLQWRGVRQVLNLLMDMYFAEHINYENGAPLLNEKEDIFPYFNLLRGYEKQLTEELEAKPCTLEMPYAPKVFSYKDIYEVDKYFNTPYRPEFSNLQDILFLRNEFVENPFAYSIELLFPEYRTLSNTAASTASNSGTSHFTISDKRIKVLAFMRNGRDVSATYRSEIFSDDDTIELLLEKSKYHQMFSYNDTIKKAIKKGYIKRTDNSYSLEYVPFVEKETKLYVETPQYDFQKYITFLTLESGSFKIKPHSDSKGFYFLFKGEEAQKIFNISYNGIVFRSNYVVDEKVPLSIPFEQYRFTVVSNKIVSVALKINGILFSTSLRSDSPIEIVLPEHLYHFEFENQDTKRVISISKSGEINFEIEGNVHNPQMLASQSPQAKNQLAVINNSLATVGDDEPIHKSRFFWLKIASIVVFVLALVGIGYWFIFPMLKDPTKAYIAFNSESKIEDIHFLTNIDERTYEIDSACIRLKKGLPETETKLVITFAEEGKDTVVFNREQLSKLATMVQQGNKDTLKIDIVSPARFFLAEVQNWKNTHADPKGALFLAEAKKRNYLTEKLRPEFEKAVWENFLKDFDYSAYNSEQVDSLLRPYLRGGASELKSYQKDLEQIISQTKSRENQEDNIVEVATPMPVDTPAPIRESKPVATTPKSNPEPKKNIPTSHPIKTTTVIVEGRDSKTVVRRTRTGARPHATNVSLTEEFIADLKRFNSPSCSEEVVDKVKINAKRLSNSDWEVVSYDFNQNKNEIEERVRQYVAFFTAVKTGGSIENLKPPYFGGQSNIIYFLKRGDNFKIVKGKTNLKTFTDIRQAIINTGVEPKSIR
ncbi:hypothetical protein [Capnocytophaga sputigena]|jgi:hypothetical protein|uniref:hypothetical protein n=1 Tax=Capnocytophaga sputigena TaxID=1019 RepID=UPI00288C4D19|nr:hypothetical protein [Capnocytophaga sputigena]